MSNKTRRGKGAGRGGDRSADRNGDQGATGNRGIAMQPMAIDKHGARLQGESSFASQKFQCVTPLELRVKELTDIARSDIEREVGRRLLFYVSMFGVVIALVVLLLGNGIINSVVRERMEAKLVELEEAKVKALVAAERATESSQKADRFATTALDRASQLNQATQARLEVVEERLAKVDKALAQAETQAQQLPSILRAAINVSVEASVAQVALGKDPTFVANSQIPVYIMSTIDADLDSLIRDLSAKGFRAVPFRNRGRSFSRREIVYSCGWREENDNLYHLAAYALGLPYPVRKETSSECAAGWFLPGVTIVIP